MIKMNKALARDVLDRVARGDSDATIAAALGLTVHQVNTVRTGQLWSRLRARMGIGVGAPAPTWTSPVNVRPRRRSRRVVQSTGSGPLPMATATDPYVGFRMWYVKDDGLPRATAHAEFTWTTQTLDAICLNDSSHQAPEADCHCGIHANNTIAALEERLGRYHGDGENRVVVAAVQLTGKVEQASEGYRASRAKVIAVATPKIADVSADDMVTATVAHNLQVPMVPYEHLATYASDFGDINESLWAWDTRRSRHLKEVEQHIAFREQQRA